jgi:hypothetical protein
MVFPKHFYFSGDCCFKIVYPRGTSNDAHKQVIVCYRLTIECCFKIVYPRGTSNDAHKQVIVCYRLTIDCCYFKTTIYRQTVANNYLLRCGDILCILTWHLLGHAIKSVTCFYLQFSRSTRPMTSFCIFIAYINTEGILFNVKITRWD